MPPTGKNAHKRKMMRNRKYSSISLDHSHMNSGADSNKNNDSNFNFKIQVIEPIELVSRENVPVKSTTMSVNGAKQ